MKKEISIFMFILFFSSVHFVSGYEFNESAGIQFLEKELQKAKYNKPIPELSLVFLVLKQENITEKILSELKSDGSFNRNVKDTAFALLAFSSVNKIPNKTIDWLKKQQIVALTGGEWLIQINSPFNGTFKIRYNNDNKEKTLTYQDQKIVECNSYAVSIGSCLGEKIKKEDEFTIDCSNIGCTKVTLIYKEGNDYYLIDEIEGSGNLRLENSCFPQTSGGSSCNYESTGYASWVLRLLKEENVNTVAYLKKEVESEISVKRIIDHSLLYLATGNTQYRTWIEEHQNNLSGSFDNNVFATALALLSVGDVGSLKAKEWLQFQQVKNPSSQYFGSWNNGNFFDTAFVVYSLKSEFKPVPQPKCGDGNCSLSESTASCPSDCGTPNKGRFCGDSIIQKPNDEGLDEECEIDDDKACPGTCSDCQCEEGAEGEGEGECIPACQGDEECVDGVCQTKEQCISDGDCFSDEQCLNNKCQKKVQCTSNDECVVDEDCEEEKVCNTVTCSCEEIEEQKKSIWPTLLIIFFIILILSGVFYYFYMRQKKPKKPEPFKPMIPETRFKPAQRPIMPQPRPGIPQQDKKETDVERKLDESIRKAKEMIGKK